MRFSDSGRMMDTVKEIYEAISQRIRTPFLGYVFLSFAGFNWKPLYFLFFSGEPSLVKFSYFDASTSLSTLLLGPFGVGLGATLAAPYIADWGAWWATSPTNSKRIREVSAAHKVLQAKNQLAAERESERAIYEESLINQAKRDQEIKDEITDEDIKAELEEKIESSRVEAGTSSVVGSTPDDSQSVGQLMEKLSKYDVQLLTKFADARSGKGSWREMTGGKAFEIGNVRVLNSGDRKGFLTVEASLSRLAQHHLLELAPSKHEFLITRLGYEVANQFRK